MPIAHNDRAVQTLLSVNPPFQEPSDPPERIHVLCHRGIQTETRLGIDDSYDHIEDCLRYTPYSHILSDAIEVKDIPKKTVLKFAENISYSHIDSFDENSSWDPDDFMQVLLTICTRKGNLRQRKDSMKEQNVDEECQTNIMVRPMFLELDDVANVVCNIQVQTSRTFTPNASMEHVDKDLHSYYYHMTAETTVLGMGPKESNTENADARLSQAQSKRSSHVPSTSSRNPSTRFNDSACRFAIEEIWNVCEECCDEYGEIAPPVRTSSTRLQYTQIANHPICRYTSEDIEQICLQCYDESEVLEKIKSWYDEVEDIITEDIYEENIDPITGNNLDEIEAQMISGVNMTSDLIEAQAVRMSLRYGETGSKDLETQCNECVDQQVSEECTRKTKSKSCTCDCQLYVTSGSNSNTMGFNICAEKLAELCQLLTSGRLGIANSTPILMSYQGSGEASSDLATSRVKTDQSNKARMRTNCKCNCLYSQGCLHCKKALEMEGKSKPNKQSSMSQNILFLWEVEEDYAEAYIEGLDQDDAFTQTDFLNDCIFCPNNLPGVKPQPCPCLGNVEMPWDMLLLPPTPKKRLQPAPESPANAGKIVSPLFDALPDVVLAQLRELTVRPITEEQLLILTKEFLEDNISKSEDIEEIQKQILAEKARIDAEMTTMISAGEVEIKDESEEEHLIPVTHCRPFPPRKPFQVYNPEDEVHNEIYLDRVRRYFDDEIDVGPCSSHVEMPWNDIALAKKILIRKGPHPCQRLIKKVEKDPNRKCGPLYREKMRQQNKNDLCENETCVVKISKKGFSDTDINKKLDNCLCNPSGSTSQPNLPAANTANKSPPKGSTKEAIEKKSGIISCLKNSKKEKNMSASVPDVMKKANSYVCSRGKKATENSSNNTVSMGKPPQTRTERIAALLESCKREMEPIKDGINQLRSRIKELNIPDLMKYPDPMQQSGMADSSSLPLSYMGGAMPPMCYPPPMMCYAFPPYMYPPGASANAQVSRLPPEMGKGSKRQPRSRRRRPPSSSFNTTSDTNTLSSEYDQPLLQEKKVMRKTSCSRSKLLCTCKPQDSTADASPNECKTNVSSAGDSDKSSSDETQLQPSSAEKCARHKQIICACKPSITNNKSLTSAKSDKQSMIPRRKDCTCKKGLSVATQKTYKSCASNSSTKSVISCRSRSCRRGALIDSMPNENKKSNVSCGDATKAYSTKQGKAEVGKYSSDEVMMVKSCATQNSAPEVPKEKPKTCATAVSCKIRFEEQSGKVCKCCRSRRCVETGSSKPEISE